MNCTVLTALTAYSLRVRYADGLPLRSGRRRSSLYPPVRVLPFLHRSTVARAERFEAVLNEYPIADNAKAKTLVCRLSALRDEIEVAERSSDEILELIFETDIDIEHIESVNHKDEVERGKIHALWQGELHRVGNLMVLETSLNRSISNGDYKGVKLPSYRSQSAFTTVRRHALAYEDWHLDACKTRRSDEVRKLVAYLCT